MKKETHKAQERGKSELDWLHSKFSFSFANYYNPRKPGFGKLLVLNDDIIEPGKGFSSHPHENMEIITVVTEGKLAHKDSTGAEEIVLPGEVQVMSAGSGIIHSEYNASKTDQVKLLQIWIETKEQNISPSHDKKRFNLKQNSLVEVVSNKKSKEELYIHQDAKISLGKFKEGKNTNYKIMKDSGVFVFLIEGKIEVEDEKLERRDAIAISDTPSIKINVLKDSYFVIIDIPMK